MAQVSLPCLGVINVGLDTAPFQYNPTDPNLYYACFDNNSASLNGYGSGSCYGSNGYFGLRAYYNSICATDVKIGTATKVTQIAGVGINSFGIYEYKALLSNPFQYVAAPSGFANAFSPMAVGFPFNTQIYVGPDGSYGSGSYAQFVNVSFPTFMTENISVNPNSIILNSTTAIGAISAHLGFFFPLCAIGVVDANFNQVAGFGCFPSSTGSIGQETAGPQICAKFGNLTNQGNRSAIPDYVNLLDGLNYISLPTITQLNTNQTYCFSPATGYSCWFYNNVGYFMPSYTSIALTYAPVIPNTWVLGNASDDAILLKNGTQSSIVMTPGGGFLIWSNGLDTNLTTMFYITPNFTGYFKINLQPKSSAAATALGNESMFGMDLSGNIWITGSTTGTLQILYSTVNLSKTLNFSPLPNFNFQSIGCKRINGKSRFIWEG